MIHVGRQELYEQVWSEPVARLAVRYGVSGVALGKVCRRLALTQVENPPRVYQRWRDQFLWKSSDSPPVLQIPDQVLSLITPVLDRNEKQPNKAIRLPSREPRSRAEGTTPT